MENRETPDAIPLLVVEEAHPCAGEKCVEATIRLGGHPFSVLLDFARRDLGIRYVKMPALLEVHRASQVAVIELMARVYNGEILQFPVDLSGLIRGASPPSPFEPMSAAEQKALDEAADRVGLQMTSIVRSDANPTHLAVTLTLDGKIMELQVELLAGHQRIPVMRWLKGPNPDSLSAAQLYAIQRALLRTYA